MACEWSQCCLNDQLSNVRVTFSIFVHCAIRREAYTMGDLTLITYIGDEKEASMPEKPPQPPAALQATTFHSLPR